MRPVDFAEAQRVRNSFESQTSDIIDAVYATTAPAAKSKAKAKAKGQGKAAAKAKPKKVERKYNGKPVAPEGDEKTARIHALCAYTGWLTSVLEAAYPYFFLHPDQQTAYAAQSWEDIEDSIESFYHQKEVTAVLDNCKNLTERRATTDGRIANRLLKTIMNGGC